MFKRVVFFIVVLPLFVGANVSIAQIAQKAKSGDVGAIYQLGYIYENGLNVEVDKEKAYKLYKKAAQLGSLDAKLSLELLTLDNEIGKKISSRDNSITIASSGSNFLSNLSTNDLTEIIQNAKRGDKEALYTLGVMYENGLGPIKQNLQKAQLFYLKAAKAGSKKAAEVLKLQ